MDEEGLAPFTLFELCEHCIQPTLHDGFQHVSKVNLVIITIKPYILHTIYILGSYARFLVKYYFHYMNRCRSLTTI